MDRKAEGHDPVGFVARPTPVRVLALRATVKSVARHFRFLVPLTLIAILALWCPAASKAAEDLAGFPELPNFHKVDDNLFRGGQPAAEGGVARLKTLGIRTIVNLRYERDLVDSEGAEASAAGINYVNVPMRGLNRPTDAQIARVLSLIDDPSARPVFVHCKAGCDRTGAVVACYRIARAKWTAEKAIREALDYGMMKAEVFKRAFIREFYAKLRSAVSAPSGV